MLEIEKSKIEVEKNQLIYSKKANNFYYWIFQEINPSLQNNVLEIGAGIGNLSKIFVNNISINRKIFLADLEENYLSNLRKNFKKKENVSIEFLDLNDISNFLKKKYRIDSCVLINVLEHIENDTNALININKILTEKGNLIVLVPALQRLYNIIDIENGHYRRYSKKDLAEKAANAGFKIEKLYYFNFFGIFGWILNGNILKKSIINENALGIFNKLVPFMKFIDKHIIRKKIGVSLIAILHKK